MTRRVAMTALDRTGNQVTKLLTTDEVVQIIQEHLASCRALGWGTSDTEVALEHALADHEGRSDLVLWPAAHRLVDVTRQDCLRLSSVTTTWPGE